MLRLRSCDKSLCLDPNTNPALLPRHGGTKTDVLVFILPPLKGVMLVVPTVRFDPVIDRLLRQVWETPKAYLSEMLDSKFVRKFQVLRGCLDPEGRGRAVRDSFNEDEVDHRVSISSSSSSIRLCNLVKHLRGKPDA